MTPHGTPVAKPFLRPSTPSNPLIKTLRLLGFTLPIEKVPIPLVMLTPQFLADSGGVKVEDALRYVSGVTNTGRTSKGGRLNRIQTPFRNTGEGGSVFARGFVPILRDFTLVTPHDDWDHEDKGYTLRLVQHVAPNTTLLASFGNSEIDAVHYFNIGQGRIQANAQGQFVVGPARMIVEPRKTDHRGLSFKLLHSLKLGKSEHKISAGYRDNRDTNFGYAYFDRRVFSNVATIISDNSGPKAVSFPGAARSVFSLNDPFATPITGVASATNPDPVPVRSAYLTDYATFLDGRLSLLAGAQHIDIRSQGKTATSPQFGATYEFAKGHNLYALTSHSYRPNSPASTVNPSLGFLDPEKRSGREIGLKLNPAGRKLSGKLALYRITRENIVQFLGGVFTQNNNIPSGEEISKGLDSTSSTRPCPISRSWPRMPTPPPT